MIFVTLGTQDKAFPRLLKAVEEEIISGNIKEEVIVQAGHTNFHSEYMQIFDFKAKEEIVKLIEACSLLITHGGVGSIVSDGLKHHKKVIAAPRLKKYKEHTNDHQLQIIDTFEQEGYLLAFREGDQLSHVLEKAKSFCPKEFISNTENMIKIVEQQIR